MATRILHLSSSPQIARLGLRAYSANIGIPISPPAPVPLITQDDLAQYSSPLTANGWHFRQTTKTLENPNYTATWWQLHHSARFPSFKAAMAYVNDVADLAKANKHHPTILISDRVNVALSLDTHDTEERNGIRDSLDHQAVVGRWPGITLRDIRMALLVGPLLDFHGATGRFPRNNMPIPDLAQLYKVHILS
ncbi:hypothetical protein BDV93DRAFT_356807 [Ceratobasidium sp. AG-I]|nr:hypothetical protein BDV93DRAFT_356807 [Ceratobasidium sp. AG-I]